MERDPTNSATTSAATPTIQRASPTQVVAARGAAEIAPGDISGGPNTSHTIMVGALAALLNGVPADARFSDYERAALEGNVLGKQTDGARRRTFRYLRELYLLRPDALLFRALRDLWRRRSGRTAAARWPLRARSRRCLPSEQRGDHGAPHPGDIADRPRFRRGSRRALPWRATAIARWRRSGETSSPRGSRRAILLARGARRRCERGQHAIRPTSRMH